MPGSMTADAVQAQVAALQRQFDNAHSPEELNALGQQVAAFQAQLGNELKVDGDAFNVANAAAQEADRKYSANPNQHQYADKANDAWRAAQPLQAELQVDSDQMSALTQLLGKIKGRAMVAKNPELEQKLAGPLADISAKLKGAGVPDEAAAAMMGTIQSKNIQPEKAGAAFMVMRGHISHESGVPPEHINDIAAGLAVTQLESELPPEHIQEAFHYFLNIKSDGGAQITTPANAQALVSAYTNRLADFASKQTPAVKSAEVSAADATTLRDALRGDYAHFFEQTEGDGAIAALLAGAVTDKADRGEVWKQYQFFDSQQGVDSVQAAVLTAGMMSRVTDVADIQQMRTQVMSNYHDILSMTPPDSMSGATVSPMVAAGYAGAGMGPHVVVIDNGPTFGDLMLYSWFMSSHPVYGYGYYGSYSSGYSAGYWSGRAMASPAYTSYRSSFGTPAALRPPPSISAINSLTRVSASPTGAASFGTRAATGTGAIGAERLSLGQGIGRNTTILGSTGTKTILAPQATRAPGGGLSMAPSLSPAAPRTAGTLSLGAGVGRTATIGGSAPSAGRGLILPPSSVGSAAPTGSSSFGRVGGSSFGGISG